MSRFFTISKYLSLLGIAAESSRRAKMGRPMSLIFFKTYLTDEDTYRQYLTPTYVAALSHPKMPIGLASDFVLEE